MREYKGQEKVRILEGECKGSYGYVRIVFPDGTLRVVLSNGRKLNVSTNEIEFIHPHYFLSDINPELIEKE